MMVNDPRSFYRYLLSSKYGQKNSGLNGDSNPDLLRFGAVHHRKQIVSARLSRKGYINP